MGRRITENILSSLVYLDKILFKVNGLIENIGKINVIVAKIRIIVSLCQYYTVTLDTKIKNIRVTVFYIAFY